MITTSSYNCQLVLRHDRVRYIVRMVRHTHLEADDILEKWFGKLEETEKDSDEMAYEDCLADFRESAISACKDTIYTLSASTSAPGQKRQSLEDYLYPTTFWLEVVSGKDALQARKIDNTIYNTSRLEPATLPTEFVSKLTSPSTSVLNLDFIDDLYVGEVFKVSQKGKVGVFKIVHPSGMDQLMR